MWNHKQSVQTLNGQTPTIATTKRHTTPKNSVSQRLRPSAPLGNHGGAVTTTARKGVKKSVICNQTQRRKPPHRPD